MVELLKWLIRRVNKTNASRKPMAPGVKETNKEKLAAPV